MPPDSINPTNITTLTSALSAEENIRLTLQIRNLPQSIGLPPQCLKLGVFRRNGSTRAAPSHNQYFDILAVE